jgi:hypothetical protein
VEYLQGRFSDRRKVKKSGSSVGGGCIKKLSGGGGACHTPLPTHKEARGEGGGEGGTPDTQRSQLDAYTTHEGVTDASGASTLVQYEVRTTHERSE